MEMFIYLFCIGIRNKLLESEDHVCPSCDSMDVSPDGLIANQMLRRAVTNFQNETGYTKDVQKAAALKLAQEKVAEAAKAAAAAGSVLHKQNVVPRGPSVLDYKPPSNSSSPSQIQPIKLQIPTPVLSSPPPESHNPHLGTPARPIQSSLSQEPPTPTIDEPVRSTSYPTQPDNSHSHTNIVQVNYSHIKLLSFVNS